MVRQSCSVVSGAVMAFVVTFVPSTAPQYHTVGTGQRDTCMTDHRDTTSYYLTLPHSTSHYLTPHNPILHPPTRTAEAPAHTFATTEQLSKYTRRFWFLLNCRNHQFRGSYRCQLCVLISRTSKRFQRIQHAAVNPIHGLVTVATGVSCLEAVPQPGRGLPRAGPGRCEDEVKWWSVAV